MLNNHFRTFLAQLLGGRVLALITVLGLAAGLCACLLIALFVSHELRYDAFYSKADAIHRLAEQITLPDGSEFRDSTVPPPVAPLLEEHFPEVEMVTRVRKMGTELNNGEAVLSEEDFYLVDKNFFAVFEQRWLRGDPAVAFATPGSVVLTAALAEQHFGSADPLGQILEMDDGVLLTVSGVVADLPSNTHFTAKAFASLDLLEVLLDDAAADLADWWGQGFHTYVVLAPESDVAAFDVQLASLIAEHAVIPPNMPPGVTVALRNRLPLKSLHLQSRNGNEFGPGGSVALVQSFAAIGLGILMIACFNFINISTAWATRRFSEVGVRKTLGATREQLGRQFIVESCLLCGAAMLLALAGVELLLPTLDAMLGVDLRAGYGSAFATGAVLTLVTLALGVLAGWYPALRLAAVKPVAVLKGSAQPGHTGVALRGVLVLLQFAIVIVLLVAIAAIQLQLRHLQGLDLGFRRDNVVLIHAARAGIQNQYAALREALLQHEAIVSVTTSEASPLRDTQQSMSVMQGEGDAASRTLPTLRIDDDFFATYGIELLAGRLLSPEFPSDRLRRQEGVGAVVINSRAAREFGWDPQSALGRSVIWSGGTFPVVGVVADTIENARVQATPVLYFSPAIPMAGDLIAVRVNGTQIGDALAHIDAQWNIFSPDKPIQRKFLDDTIAALYLQETRQLQLATWFSALALLIACMGLYGLVAFSTACRTKEIGIRKVMGSSSWRIVLLFTQDLSRLVLLANVIAWPVAYVVMTRWLENFAYRIDLTPLLFIGSGLIVLCIAWVTVGGTAAKAASARPRLALRYE